MSHKSCHDRGTETCVLHRRVRIPKTMISHQTVQRDLVIRDERQDQFGSRDPLVCYTELSKNYIVPRQYGLRYVRDHGLPFEDRIPPGDKIDVRFKGTLRSAQTPVVEETMEALLKEEGATMNLYCGFGKTTCANMISCKIGLKTLVLVHTSALATQWRDRIEQFVEGASIGMIRQDKFDVEGRTHVIALMQSVCRRTYGINAFDSFGLMIVDEAHHVCATELSKCVKIAGPRYRLGLSATPFRKDGYTPYLFNAIGRISSSVSRKNDTQELHVNTVWITDGPSEVHEVRRYGGKKSINISRMITDLCQGRESENRTRCIVQCILDMVRDGRHVIVLSDRRDHVGHMSESLKRRGFDDYGFMIGGAKDDQLKSAEKNSVIFATYAFCSEGVDVPSLDTILFTTPRSDIVQCVGRILRVHRDKKTPLVVDFVDSSYVFRNQYKKRESYYSQLGGRVTHLDQDLRTKTSVGRRRGEEELAVGVDTIEEENEMVLDRGMITNFVKRVKRS